MPERSDIFAKQRLTIAQLRAVADRRFGDAVALIETGDNARANGAQYLAGIVIEILLKGQLLQNFPSTSTADAGKLSGVDRERWNLVWRSHDLSAMLDELPALRGVVANAGKRAVRPYLAWLTGFCGSWTIHARYSPATSTMAEARQMVDRVRQLKEVIR